MDKQDIAKICKYCKDFRENTLKISLTNFCEINNENIKKSSISYGKYGKQKTGTT